MPNDNIVFPTLATFKRSDLDGKVLRMVITETDDAILISGQEITTNKIYILDYKEKPNA